MTLASLRAFALRLPQATVVRQWGGSWVFKVGGKLFLVVVADGDIPVAATFKPRPQDRAALSQREGLRLAPYLARAGWVQVDDMDSVASDELRPWILASYQAACLRVSKRERTALGLHTGP